MSADIKMSVLAVMDITIDQTLMGLGGPADVIRGVLDTNKDTFAKFGLIINEFSIEGVAPSHQIPQGDASVDLSQYEGT